MYRQKPETRVGFRKQTTRFSGHATVVHTYYLGVNSCRPRNIGPLHPLSGCRGEYEASQRVSSSLHQNRPKPWMILTSKERGRGQSVGKVNTIDIKTGRWVLRCCSAQMPSLRAEPFLMIYDSYARSCKWLERTEVIIYDSGTTPSLAIVQGRHPEVPYSQFLHSRYHY